MGAMRGLATMAIRRIITYATVRAGLFACALLVGMAPQASGQDGDEGSPGGLCWRGRPRPACAAFPLIEIQGMLPLVSAEVPNPPAGPLDVFGRRMEGSLGFMVNSGPRWAFGATVFGGGSDQGGSQQGFRLRARRWVGQRSGVEFMAGTLRDHRNAEGFVGEVRLTRGDLFAFFVRWNGLDLPPKLDQPNGSVIAPGGFKQAFDVGGAVGSTIATALFGVALALAPFAAGGT